MNKKLIILLLPIIIILGIVFVMHSSLFAIKEIQVVGNSSLGKVEIVKASNVKIGENLLMLPINEVANQLMKNVRIRGVKLERDLPDRLIIRVSERPGIGLFPTKDGVLEISTDGVVLAKYTAKDIKPVLPYVEGLNVNLKNGRVVMTWEVENFLTFLKGLSPYRKKLTKVSYSPGNTCAVFGAYTKVNFGHVASLEKNLADFHTIWNSIPNIEKTVEYIEMRYAGKTVIKRK